jgi:galactokinase
MRNNGGGFDHMKTKELLSHPKLRDLFGIIYGENDSTVERQTARYRELLRLFHETFPDDKGAVELFSTPGRTEVGGNHTDHNGGRVLAAAVSLDAVAAARKNDSGIITLYSKGYNEPFRVDIDDMASKPHEKETTTALIRGIAARFVELGYKIGGFDAYITSDVLRGSGLSSSAAVEVLIGTILNALYNEGCIEPEVLAMIGQYAENVYFGKPCGLMDQLACAVGGFVTIDFKEASRPVVRKIDFDFASQDYSLLVVDTGGNHVDLTQDYADVPGEMKSIAQALGKKVLRELSMSHVIERIPELRNKASDRAILRAMHFFADDQRVLKQVRALEEGRFQDFLRLVIESGNSSWRWLQNCYTTQNPSEQGVTLALAVTENFVAQKGRGAYRVHGGGFAGTIQVFLPNDCLDEYIRLIGGIFGDRAVSLLTIRPYGTLHINTTIQ